MNDWQPIATAPKDKRIRLWRHSEHIGYMGLYGEWVAEGDAEAFTYGGPTHWAPLSKGPSQEERS